MINGVAVGVVVSTKDPENLRRIRIDIPARAGTSLWARVVKPVVANAEYFAPEIGDQVLVAFENGDPNRPFVLGGLWSAPANAPTDAANIDE
jgi:uncharacterized protein involved in type VI secretion and phage assembly